MAFEWFLNFVSYENIEVVSIALGVLVFVVAYDLMKRMMDRRMSFIVCLIIGIMLAWRVYSAPELVTNAAFGILMMALVAGVGFIIVRAFFRSGKHNYDKFSHLSR
jgi:xanthine/uracil permease